MCMPDKQNRNISAASAVYYIHGTMSLNRFLAMFSGLSASTLSVLTSHSRSVTDDNIYTYIHTYTQIDKYTDTETYNKLFSWASTITIYCQEEDPTRYFTMNNQSTLSQMSGPCHKNARRQSIKGTVKRRRGRPHIQRGRAQLCSICMTLNIWSTEHSAGVPANGFIIPNFLS